MLGAALLLLSTVGCALDPAALRPCPALTAYRLFPSTGERPYEAEGSWANPAADSTDASPRLYILSAEVTHDFESWLKKPYANFWIYVIPYEESVAAEAARYGSASEGHVLGRFLRGANSKIFRRQALLDSVRKDPRMQKTHLPGPYESGHGFCEWADTDEVAPQRLAYRGLAIYKWNNVERALVLVTEGDDSLFDDFVGLYVVSLEETLNRSLSLSDDPAQPFGEGRAAAFTFLTVGPKSSGSVGKAKDGGGR